MNIQHFSFMKKVVHTMMVLGMLVALPMSNAQAQGMRGGDPNARPNPRFDVAPKIGDQMPDLTIFDDMGKPVNIRDITKEHYTVLVLGCLT
jgi:hypothetical protein